MAVGGRAAVYLGSVGSSAYMRARILDAHPHTLDLLSGLTPSPAEQSAVGSCFVTLHAGQ